MTQVAPVVAAGAAPRTVHVVTQREPAGAQRVAHLLCQGFRRRGLGSDVVFLYRREDAFDDEGYLDLRADRPGVIGTLGLVARLTATLRRVRPDAVVGHTFHANVVASVAGALAGVRRRVVVHHVLAEFESAPRRAVIRALRRSPLVSAEVYVSEATRASFGPAAARAGIVIHNGVELPAGPGPGAWAGDPRPDRDRPLIVSVGRLAAQKDHGTLLRALSQVPEAHLAIVGEGELRDDLLQLRHELRLDDRVSLVGNIPPDEVPAALAAADLVVQPSIWETFGMVVVEAMAAGRATVASDVAAHREVLGDCGRYHPVGDAGALAAAISDLLADAPRRAELGRRAAERSRRFGHDETVDRYLEVVGA